MDSVKTQLLSEPGSSGARRLSAASRGTEPLHVLAEQSPRDPLVWLNLGRALLAKAEGDSTDNAAASAALLHALSLEPTDVEVLRDLADALGRSELHDAARHAYQRLLTVDPDCIEARISLAELELPDHPESALTTLQTAPNPVAANARFFVTQARCLKALGDLKGAAAATRRAVALPGVDIVTLWFHAQLLGELGLKAPCISAWKQVVAAAPEDPRAHTALGSALVAGGQYTAGIAALLQVANRHADSPDAWVNVGLAQLAAGDTAAATVSARRALSLDPNHPQGLDQLGQCLERQGKLSEAASIFAQVVQQQPRSAAARQRLGVVLGAIGQRDRARAELLAAYELEPENEEITRQLALLGGNSPSTIPPSASAFQGTLSAFSIIDALEFLKNLRATGKLVISRHDEKGSITLSSGLIASAVAPNVGSIVHELLASRDLTREQLTEAMRQLGKPCSGRDILLRLLERRVLSQEAIDRATALQVRKAVRALLTWTDGKFAFHKGTLAPLVSQVLLDSGALVLDLMREADETGGGLFGNGQRT